MPEFWMENWSVPTSELGFGIMALIGIAIVAFLMSAREKRRK